MFVSHAPIHLPNFQQLAHSMMSRLTPTQAEPEPMPGHAGARVVGVALVEHWDLLFSAVTERLESSMATLEAAMAGVPGTGPATAATRTSVLECVEALTQLRTTMRDALESKRP